MVKEIHSYGGDINSLVPDYVLERMKMPEAEINFEDIAKGNVRIDIVDKLENLRASLESNSLTGRVNKKEIITI